MVNEIWIKRDFLTSINQIDEVNELWVIRAKSVSEQFGKSSLEMNFQGMKLIMKF